jgi:hypothetical protein
MWASVKRLLRIGGSPCVPVWAEIHIHPWLPILGLSHEEMVAFVNSKDLPIFSVNLPKDPHDPTGRRSPNRL